jgi:MSHA biogenesis protein MshJ
VNARAALTQACARAQRAFDARPVRERVLLCAVAAAVAFWLVDALWFTPAFKRWHAGRTQHQAVQTQMAALQSDLLRLQAQYLADEQRLRQEGAAWRTRLREGEELLRRHDDLLIGPERMLQLLQQLLQGRGELRVRAMQSLSKVELLTDLQAAASGAPALYRHGVELVIEGRYAELLAYLQSLEQLPQKLQFGDLQFRVEQHPRCVLTLRVYTLSLDKRWLEI